MIRTTRTRRGVTLVELLVAAALLMLGMWLLVWLYQQGMASFLTAKAQADLTTQERTVATVMTRDLGSPFFLGEDGKPNRGVRLSDQRMDQVMGGWNPPKAGFFSARSRSFGTATYVNANNVYEAADGDGFITSRSTDHFLQFTIILQGGPNYQMVGAEIPVGTGNQFFGRAAEVTYALVPNGLYTTGAGPLPLFDLIRRQRLTALSVDDQPTYQTGIAPYLAPYSAANPNPYGIADNVNEVTTFSGNGTGSVMLTMSDLTNPANRLPQAQWALSLATSRRYGEERLMSNVLSFEVKFTGPPVNVGAGAFPSDPTSTQWPRPLGATNSDYPYDILPYDGQFDTYSSQLLAANWQTTQVATVAQPTNPIKALRITGVMIRLRGYDPKNQTTRQTTIVSPL
jgi:hypothetical protein